MDKTTYIQLATTSAGYSEEDWWSGCVPDDMPDPATLTRQFLESGGIAWGFPVHEKPLAKARGCHLGHPT